MAPENLLVSVPMQVEMMQAKEKADRVEEVTT